MYVEQYPYMIDVPEAYIFELFLDEKSIEINQFRRCNNITVLDKEENKMDNFANYIVLYNYTMENEKSFNFSKVMFNIKNKFNNSIIKEEEIFGFKYLEKEKFEHEKTKYHNIYKFVNEKCSIKLNFYKTMENIYILDIFVVLCENNWNKYYDLFSLLCYSILYYDIKNKKVKFRYEMPPQINDYLNYKKLYLMETFSYVEVENFLENKLFLHPSN